MELLAFDFSAFVPVKAVEPLSKHESEGSLMGIRLQTR